MVFWSWFILTLSLCVYSWWIIPLVAGAFPPGNTSSLRQKKFIAWCLRCSEREIPNIFCKGFARFVSFHPAIEWFYVDSDFVGSLERMPLTVKPFRVRVLRGFIHFSLWVSIIIFCSFFFNSFYGVELCIGENQDCFGEFFGHHIRWNAIAYLMTLALR